MKKLFVMAFMAVAASTGCQREIADHYVQENDILNVYAMIEGAEDTKTSLKDIEVFWNSSDRIAVFLKNSLRKRFDVSSESVGSKEGTFVYDSDYIVIGKEVTISNNVAYYPFAEVTCTPGSSAYSLENISLPLTQYYSPSSFGQDAFPMVAVTVDTDDLDFAFKNLCGVLEFQLKGTGTILSVAVKGNSEEILAGKAIVTAAYGKNPEISLLPDGSKTVTLDCGDSGVALQNDTPTSFFIVLPPVSFDNGFTVTVTDAAGTTAEYSTTKKNIVHRSGILRMPEKEYVAERVPQEDDYIDEYGINHGPGVEIDGVVWAPVNCGYHATDYPYGKLYQWGRKYGQGYSGGLYDGSCNSLGGVSDATVPEIREGGVSLAGGQSEENANVFFLCDSENNYDWVYPSDGTLWNSGTESDPDKTEYDPCPDGWRVPTYAELDDLRQNKSSWTTNDKNQEGYWFSGQSSYTSSVPQVFFPATGYRYYIDGSTNHRGYNGYYWSLRTNDSLSGAPYLNFRNGYTDMHCAFHADGYSVRCVYDENAVGMEWPVPDDNVEIPVSTVIISTSSLKHYEGYVAQLTTKLRPIDATDTVVTWSSDTPSVATVDQSGLVTGISVGKATITAVAGGVSATCSVTVSSPAVATANYVDEYGKNHGKGIAVGMTVWAPVNCGYHETDYPYGKIYQWGRKYGQGYSGGLYDGSWNYLGDISDATVPEIREGGVSLAGGQSEENANVFFLGDPVDYYYYYGDWLYPSDDTLWNSGTESDPVKTEYDPCPDGWRVPTYAELEELSKNKSSWTANDKNQEGYWLSGQSSYTLSAPQVFFPAAGGRDCYDGSANVRGSNGNYWSSGPNDYYAYCLGFGSDYYGVAYSVRSIGYSVRCVYDENAVGMEWPVPDDNVEIPVSTVIISTSSLKLYEGNVAQLTTKLRPIDATDTAVTWSSDTPSVATVDQSGLVTGISAGKATITAVAGGVSATCSVTVSSLAVATANYVDEYGKNHGKGIAVGMTVWAPVNCGYHETDYPYGKLYQWGRKYGQGYSGTLSDIDGNAMGEVSDATVPEIRDGAISLSGGQSEENVNVFFLVGWENNCDWVYPSDDTLWNSGTEEEPVKTEYDPCPDGWRVPTYSELDELSKNKSSWTTNDKQQTGYWFSGQSSYTSSVPQVFFPAAGYREYYYYYGSAYARGGDGNYWSSRSSDYYSSYLYFCNGYTNKGIHVRAYGSSVRCVQENQ